MVEFFIGKNETIADFGLSAESLMKHDPEYYGPRFEGIADLRKSDDGSGYKGQEFRRVASFVNFPLFHAVDTLLDGKFMSDKKRFYEFLDRNREYCTYQRPTRYERMAQIQRDIGHLGKEVTP